MVRLFVAIDLPLDIIEQFMDAQERLCSSRARLTLVDRDAMHITLKFIGEVNSTHVPRISGLLQKIEVPPFSLPIGRIAVNNQKVPRIVWSEVHDPGVCADLAQRIDSELVSVGCDPEKRKFKPHVTLARIKQFDPSLLDVLAGIATSCSGSIPVKEFILKKSDLTPDGPLYTDIIRVPLRENV